MNNGPFCETCKENVDEEWQLHDGYGSYECKRCNEVLVSAKWLEAVMKMQAASRMVKRA